MFFVLSKILWFVVQPSNVILMMMFVGLGMVAQPRHRSAGQRLLVAGFAALVLAGFSPLSTLLLAPLEDRFARADLARGLPVTGLIVLGGVEDTRPGPQRELAGLNEAAERMTEAAALAARLPAAKVVFSGGNGHLYRNLPAEAVRVGTLLQALGVSADRIILEDKARNTWENATFTKAKLDTKPGERWLLITSAYHMPRAMGCFRKAGLQVEPWPVDYRTGDDAWELFNAYPHGLQRIDMVVREYIGLVAYYLVGHSTALFPK